MSEHSSAVKTVEQKVAVVQSRAETLYERWSIVPIFALTLVWIIAILFEFSPSLSPTYRIQGFVLNGFVFLAFAGDLTIRFILDSHKRTFLRRNWYLVIAVLIPPLRILFVINALLRLGRDAGGLAKQIGLSALYAVSLVVFLGATLALSAEIEAPGSNIDSFGDAVWWAFVTVTTVGYGDFTPVTVTGRSIAVVIMFTGAAAVGALTAALASFFASRVHRRSEAAQESTDIAASVGSDEEAISSLHERIEHLTAQIEAISSHLGVHREADPQGSSTRPGGGE
jgi:voltage-gated potassium channel